jgi:predicted RNA-binding Zn-ribbon protein involved in translation (DUF1610 family)
VLLSWKCRKQESEKVNMDTLKILSAIGKCAGLYLVGRIKRQQHDACSEILWQLYFKTKRVTFECPECGMVKKSKGLCSDCEREENGDSGC